MSSHLVSLPKFWCFDTDMTYAGLGILASDIRHNHNEKGVSDINWQSIKLNMIGERSNIKLVPRKLWDNMKKIYGEGILMTVLLR